MNNMDIQKKMKKGIEDVVGYGRLPCLSDKPNLPYCEAVMHESLRLENIVPFSLPHHVTNDIFYKGYKIPKHLLYYPVLILLSTTRICFLTDMSLNLNAFLMQMGWCVDRIKF